MLIPTDGFNGTVVSTAEDAAVTMFVRFNDGSNVPDPRDGFEVSFATRFWPLGPDMMMPASVP